MPRQPMRAIAIVPYATHVEPACDRGLRALEAAGIEVRRIRSGAIDRARCDAAHAALADGADTIVWIDSDIVFEADAALRLLAHDLPIVGGVYAKKGVRDLALHALPGTTELVLGAEGYLVDVRYVGLGFLATQRL